MVDGLDVTHLEHLGGLAVGSWQRTRSIQQFLREDAKEFLDDLITNGGGGGRMYAKDF